MCIALLIDNRALRAEMRDQERRIETANGEQKQLVKDLRDEMETLLRWHIHLSALLGVKAVAGTTNNVTKEIDNERWTEDSKETAQ